MPAKKNNLRDTCIGESPPIKNEQKKWISPKRRTSPYMVDGVIKAHNNIRGMDTTNKPIADSIRNNTKNDFKNANP
jgi:hypothetical protein